MFKVLNKIQFEMLGVYCACLLKGFKSVGRMKMKFV